MSKQYATLAKGRNFTIESFDIVAVCGYKVERFFVSVARRFDIVAGVDGALVAVFSVRPPCCNESLRDEVGLLQGSHVHMRGAVQDGGGCG